MTFCTSLILTNMEVLKELLVAFLVLHFGFAKRAAVNTNGDQECRRRDKYSVIGYDNGSYVNVSVGVCQTGTSELAHQGGRTLYDCLPRKSWEERHLLFDGYVVIKVDIIKTCQRVSTTCQRVSHEVLFYPGTAFSRRIDVGICGGKCRGDSQSCKPVMNKIEGISAPNGIRSISTIVKCSCVTPHCYRVSNFEAFPVQDNDAIKGKPAHMTKSVDMGKCVSEGSCPGRDFSFPKPETRCMGTTFKQHTFVSGDGRQVNVSAIATCSCDPRRN